MDIDTFLDIETRKVAVLERSLEEEQQSCDPNNIKNELERQNRSFGNKRQKILPDYAHREPIRKRYIEFGSFVTE